MIFVTGDTHIPIDISKLNTKSFPLQKKLCKDDFLIICGDFGGVWRNDKEERYWRKWLEEKRFTTLFVDGNHENFDLLSSFEEVDFHGGRARRISNSIYHLMRGQIYLLDGKTIFTFGGASSHDKQYRTEGLNWWRQELPTQEELQSAQKTLNDVNRRVDYLITHCAPTSVQHALAPAYPTDILTDFFEELKGTVSYNGWFFGHYHRDRAVDERHRCLFEEIVQL